MHYIFFRSDYRLDSLYGLLFDFPLLWQTFLCGLFIQFTWSYGALLYKVYNTEVSKTWPQGYKIFFMLNSAVHEIFHTNKSQITNNAKFFLAKNNWLWKFLC